MSKKFLKFDEIKVGSVWKPADGGKGYVVVVGKEDDEIFYTHSANKVPQTYDKSTFSFQVRYYLTDEW